MTEPPRRRLFVGPSRDGLWIVRDARGVCGAVFNSRDKALSFARAECASGAGEWRFVEALDLGEIFARAG